MIRAVIFDLGGVVFPSPVDAFRVYEQEHGLPDRFLSDVVLADPEHGAWSRLERGELAFDEFCSAFESECCAAGGVIDAAELMAFIRQDFAPRPEMITAIGSIRAHGLRTGALTNNWAEGEPGVGATGAQLGKWFDAVIESAVEGIRKPDPRIYRLVCDRLGVVPAAAVFLDDLGANLKPALALGMTTIKVADPAAALDELASVLGFPLD